MCIIIDNNKFGEFGSPDAAPIRKWLEKGGNVVYGVGGKFKEVPSKAQNLLVAYEQEGKATRYLWNQIQPKMASLPGGIKSDDEHILALALVSGARLLFSGDKDLHDDFKNPKIIPKLGGKPKSGGRVYQTQQHESLLKASVCKKTA